MDQSENFVKGQSRTFKDKRRHLALRARQEGKRPREPGPFVPKANSLLVAASSTAKRQKREINFHCHDLES